MPKPCKSKGLFLRRISPPDTAEAPLGPRGALLAISLETQRPPIHKLLDLPESNGYPVPSITTWITTQNGKSHLKRSIPIFRPCLGQSNALGRWGLRSHWTRTIPRIRRPGVAPAAPTHHIRRAGSLCTKAQFREPQASGSRRRLTPGRPAALPSVHLQPLPAELFSEPFGSSSCCRSSAQKLPGTGRRADFRVAISQPAGPSSRLRPEPREKCR